MARGLDNHRERMERLASFGRELARRSGSKCELCRTGGVPLSIWEVPPAPVEPDIHDCIFLCEACRDLIERNPLKNIEHWRCLNEAVWSDVTAVKVTAVRILRLMAPGQSWAADLLEQVYLDEDEEEWAGKG